MKRSIFLFLLAQVLICAPVFAGGDGLVDMLTSQVSGVSADQAAGGAGAIFGFAKDELSVDDFKKVHEAVPEMDSLLAAAPERGDVVGEAHLGEMASNRGSQVGGIGSLAGSFDQLGLKPDMIQQFTPVVLDYVKQGGGVDTMNLLKGVLQ
jgi:hypothetical protein